MEDKEKKSGFFDIEEVTNCSHPEHQPPKHIYIPQGKGYNHVCPQCGNVIRIIPQQINF